MVRHIRGLEDHETQERKRLHRDVRSPSQRLADALKLGQVQTGGIFTAGLCLLLFPACATPLFCLGLALFLARCACVNRERLPFRMPMGLTGTDRGDPLPGRGGFARPEGIFFLGNRLQDKQELWLKAKDILTHCLHNRFRQDGNAGFPVLQCAGHGKRAVLHRPQGVAQAGGADMADGPVPGPG